jgi:hypothetical protein
MERKTARLTLLIDPAKKAAFERLCASQDVTPSQVVRRLIREYLAAHGVQFVPSGIEAPEPEPEPEPGSGGPGKGRGKKARPRAARASRSKGPSGGSAR